MISTKEKKPAKTEKVVLGKKKTTKVKPIATVEGAGVIYNPTY